MLQQILDQMWIDPDLLAELDESQKQTLFCKMREEQIRRWRIWDEQTPIDLKTTRNSHPRHVDFLLDAEGKPWTWVMGEHEDDKTIEEILEEEAREAAKQQAAKEAINLRLTMEAELTELWELNKKQREEIEVAEQRLNTEDIYCSADQIRINFRTSTTSNNNNYTNNYNNNIQSIKRDALQEISFNKQHKVSQRVAQWETRMMEERTTEIYKKLQKQKMEAAKEAEEAENKHEHLWREQQRKAKEAETQIREIARRAREEHRRSMLEIEQPNNSKEMPSTLPPCLPPRKDNSTIQLTSSSKPPNKDAILEWFRTSEITRKAGLDPITNSVAIWFHGLITRQEAESLLLSQPAGTFLVRVSERIWGYAISYRDADRCKHYLIDASNGHYQFLGTNQISHSTLGDLVCYHAAHPITALGGELLGRPCHRNKPLPPPFQALSIRAR